LKRQQRLFLVSVGFAGDWKELLGKNPTAGTLPKAVENRGVVGKPSACPAIGLGGTPFFAYFAESWLFLSIP
jgi:hypothetical protein